MSEFALMLHEPGPADPGEQEKDDSSNTVKIDVCFVCSGPIKIERQTKNGGLSDKNLIHSHVMNC